MKCSGSPSVVTASAGTAFTGILNGSVLNINGFFFTVGSITDATHMVLTTAATAAQCSTTSVNIYLPVTHVTVTSGSTAVTWVDGPQFTSVTTLNQQLQLGFQTGAKVASITDATHLVLQTGTATIPNVTGTVPMYLATLISSGGAGAMPSFIHIPCGQYPLSHPVTSYGAYSSIWGDGQCSELYLTPNSTDFQSTSNPIFAVNPVNTNDTFHWFIRNLWFHIGVGNPKAIGLTFAPSNYGAIRNILISSDDAACTEGLNLGKSFTGPGMMRHVAIYGCAFGIAANIPNHNMTGEYFTIQGQTTSGIADTNISLQFRKTLFDEPALPAATNTGSGASLVVTDSEAFLNGAAQCFQNSTSI